MTVWNDFACAESTKERLVAAAQSPVHSYLFLGASQMVEAAIRFAATLIASEDDRDRVLNLALAGNHPDITVIQPEGSSLRVVDAEAAISISATTPLEAKRKVIIIPSVDVIEPNAVGKLLKVVEEPPSSAHFILLAENVIPEIITIASRCTEIRFPQLAESEIVGLLTSDGVDSALAETLATASGGSFERAMNLVTDSGLNDRLNWWAEVPGRLDGKGATISELVNEYGALIGNAMEVVADRQSVELEVCDEQIEQGLKGRGERTALVSSHKREQRKIRVQELQFGFGVLGRHYRDQLIPAESELHRNSVSALQSASENLVRNPNETLLLQDLFIKLG